ncbi:hypothetical protein MnTg02_01351 [bacterium MnTg02]|nr:hypothetical protein MnTg02_01351 [bacterium MnTg02]
MNGTIECEFIGRLGQPPDLRTAKSGKEWLCQTETVQGETHDHQ